MHEMSFATALLDQLERLAVEHGAARIARVEVTCGVLRQIVPEALRVAFEAVSAGTCAASAELVIGEETLVARCRTCQREYRAEIDNYVCPKCHAADVEIIAGNDVVLRSVAFETAGTLGGGQGGP